MPDPTDLTGTIQTAAANPVSATADGVTVNAQPIPDQIAADKYPAAKSAARGGPPWGVRFGAIISPGTQQ